MKPKTGKELLTGIYTSIVQSSKPKDAFFVGISRHSISASLRIYQCLALSVYVSRIVDHSADRPTSRRNTALSPRQVLPILSIYRSQSPRRPFWPSSTTLVLRYARKYMRNNGNLHETSLKQKTYVYLYCTSQNNKNKQKM